MLRTEKIWKTAVLASAAALLAGCRMTEEEAWTPREDAAISIDKKGKVTEYLSDELDQPYYNFDELKSMLDGEIAEYNSAHGAGRVAVTLAEQEDGRTKLVITYASGEDYASFNNVEFYYGSMINAQLEGYLFGGAFKEVRDGVVVGEEVDGSEIFHDMSDTVVIVQAPLEVQVPGDVCFTSSNAGVLRSDVVAADNPEAEDGGVSAVREEGQEDPDRVYIIFKED